MKPHILILGAGFAGHTAALHLSYLVRDKADVTVVAPNNRFTWFPSLDWVGTGTKREEENRLRAQAGLRQDRHRVPHDRERARRRNGRREVGKDEQQRESDRPRCAAHKRPQPRPWGAVPKHGYLRKSHKHSDCESERDTAADLREVRPTGRVRTEFYIEVESSTRPSSAPAIVAGIHMAARKRPVRRESSTA